MTEGTDARMMPTTWSVSARVLARTMLAAAVCAALASCTAGSGTADGSGTVAATAAQGPDTAATVPVPETTTPTTSTTTSSTTTTSTTTTTTTTTALVPPTTIAHGAGPVLTGPDGTQVASAAAATANDIYTAAVSHDYTRLAAIIGDNRFRWGFVGQRKPADSWKEQFDKGRGDELARIVALLDTPPAIDEEGNTVWPYLALKDPTTWDASDEEQLVRLGFNPENIIDTKAKGRYVDYRLIINPDGRWTTFAVGS